MNVLFKGPNRERRAHGDPPGEHYWWECRPGCPQEPGLASNPHPEEEKVGASVPRQHRVPGEPQLLCSLLPLALYLPPSLPLVPVVWPNMTQKVGQVVDGENDQI